MVRATFSPTVALLVLLVASLLPDHIVLFYPDTTRVLIWHVVYGKVNCGMVKYNKFDCFKSKCSGQPLIKIVKTLGTPHPQAHAPCAAHATATRFVANAVRWVLPAARRGLRPPLF